MSLFRELKEVILTFIKDCGNPKISACVLAICGPVFDDGRTNEINNLMTPEGELWPCKKADYYEQSLNLPKGSFRFVNDFEAIGYGIAASLDSDPFLASPKKEISSTTITFYDVPRINGAPIACIGAGTGLGAVYLTATPQNPQKYYVYPSEGGMVNIFSPETEEEWKLLQFLKTRYPEYVTIEAIVSGKGIANVFDFFHQQGKPMDPTIQKEILSADLDLKPALITEYAQKGDPTCLSVLGLFLDVYARVTAFVACTFMSYGGVYIAGGVLPKVLWRTKSPEGGKSRFISRYLDMGPSKGVVERIPIYILTSDVGSFGCLYRALDITKLLISSQ
jgi:glucokinase